MNEQETIALLKLELNRLREIIDHDRNAMLAAEMKWLQEVERNLELKERLLKLEANLAALAESKASLSAK